MIETFTMAAGTTARVTTTLVTEAIIIALRALRNELFITLNMTPVRVAGINKLIGTRVFNRMYPTDNKTGMYTQLRLHFLVSGAC